MGTRVECFEHSAREVVATDNQLHASTLISNITRELEQDCVWLILYFVVPFRGRKGAGEFRHRTPQSHTRRNALTDPTALMINCSPHEFRTCFVNAPSSCSGMRSGALHKWQSSRDGVGGARLMSWLWARRMELLRVVGKVDVPVWMLHIHLHKHPLISCDYLPA